jgi:hypothetical protein
MNYPDIIGDNGNAQPAGLARGEVVQYNNGAIARTLFAAGAPTTLAPNATASIQIQLQVPMRLEQLVLVSDLGPLTQLRVTGLRVGPTNQIVSNGGAMSALAFSPLAFSSNILAGNTAPPGVDIIIDVLNAGPQAETLLTHVKGTALTR